MKSVSFIIILIGLGVFLFFKINNADVKARKNAIKIDAVVENINCKQRLKGDKSLVQIRHRSQVYSVFFKSENECTKYKVNQKVTAYFSEKYNKLFLSL